MKSNRRIVRRVLFALTIIPLLVVCMVLALVSIPFSFIFANDANAYPEVLMDDIPYGYYEWATGKEAVSGGWF